MSAGFSELDLPNLSAYDGAFVLADIQKRHNEQLIRLGIAHKALAKIQGAEGPKPTSLDECSVAAFRSLRSDMIVGGVMLRATLPEAPETQQLGEFYIMTYRHDMAGISGFQPFTFEDINAVQSMVADLERHKRAGELPGIDSMLTHIIEPRL